MGEIFLAIFHKSFRTIKLRFLENPKTALACTGCLTLINKAIACGAALSESKTSFCDRFSYRAISRRLGAERIADCPFDSSKITADSANHYSILLAYLLGILKQNLNITKLIESIVSIATQKATFFNVTNTSTDLLIFKVNNKFSVASKKLKLIYVIMTVFILTILT